MIYYSEWFYAAIHVLISIPRFQKVSELAPVLQIEEGKVREMLEFLVSCGLARLDGKKYVSGPSRIHLGSDSPLISKHHLNWRLLAMRALERRSDRNLHYTSVVSLSDEDVEKLRGIWVESMERHNRIVAPSPEEGCHCLVLDLFKVA